MNSRGCAGVHKIVLLARIFGSLYGWIFTHCQKYVLYCTVATVQYVVSVLCEYYVVSGKMNQMRQLI